MSAAELLEPAGAGVEIVPVTTPAEMDRFIRLPYRLHANHANWVPPLLLERRETLDRKKNPFFQYAEVAFFLAVRGGRDVGRISAQVDRQRLSLRPDGVGHFGLIDGEDDPAIFAALTAAAEDWLRRHGMTHVMGPFDLSINEQMGLLVDGFDTPPMLLMAHDFPYVAPRLEALGYGKEKDVYAYYYDIRDAFPKAVRRMLDRPLPPGTVLRPVDMSRFLEEIRSLTEIFNEAWFDNWGFAPLTPTDTDYLASSIRPLIEKDLVWFIEIGGEPAAFIVVLPNLNEAITDLDGKLLPFGWAKLLWRLKVRGLKTARVPLMGVKRKFAKGLSGGQFSWLLIDACRRSCLKRGIQAFELGWILEENGAMRRMLENINARIYKTYRIYGKPL